MKNSELVQRLKKFLKDLKDHRTLYAASLNRTIPDHPIRNHQELKKQQKELSKQLYILDPYLHQLSQKRIMYHPVTGIKWNIYHASIGNDTAQIKGPSLDNAILELEGIIALLETKPHDEEVILDANNIRKVKLEEPPLFNFIKTNTKIKSILRRDYIEIQKSIQGECWKAAIILCGSSLEAILYDILKQQSESQVLKSARRAGKGKIEDWSLEKYIDVAAELKLISKGVENFSHSVRDYRNLVHPLKEVHGNYKIEREEAIAAFETLKMVIRDLKRNI